MLGRLRESVGFSGLMYAVVLAFAVAAVTLAIGTLTQTTDIAPEADRIDEELTPANRDLDAIALAEDTGDIAERIAAEVRPLPELLRIEAGVTSSIQLTVASIQDTVRSIHARVVEVHAGAQSIHAEVESVAASVDEIVTELAAVLPVARSIDRQVARINRRVVRALVPVRAIRTDVDRTRRQVGTDLRAAPGSLSIHGHANAVNCSPLLVEDQYACHGDEPDAPHTRPR